MMRREFYGIAEIADALGLSRPLVTVWRRRRSHGMPDPDAELSSGPIWRAETIEPWIDAQCASRAAARSGPVDPQLALRACRRMLRLAALLLDEPVRTRPLAAALAEAAELAPLVAARVEDDLGKAVRVLLAPVEDLPSDVDTQLVGLRHRVLAALPTIAEVAIRVCANQPVSPTAHPR